jgi:hypothetical protein
MVQGSVSALAGAHTRVGLDVVYQVTVGSWFQLSALARVDIVPRGEKAAPSRHTALSPSFGDGLANSQGLRPR